MLKPWMQIRHPGTPTTRQGVTRWLTPLIIVVVGLIGVWIAQVTGRLDSALLFVGIPCLMAFALTQVPSRSDWGTVFQVVTIVLLLASALLQEAAICVLLASPLVYGVVGLVWLASRKATKHRLALAPVLVLVALEGAVPAARIHPVQTAEASRILTSDCSTLAATLARGPRLDPSDRGRLLQITPYPTPVAVTGEGLAPGNTWTLEMPTGAITTEVRETRPDEITFDVVSDTARTTRWVGLRSGRLSWQQTASGCRTTMSISYVRKLDPSFWFGPITDTFMTSGAETFLMGLD